MLNGTVFSQNYSLPSVLFDSLVYLAMKGKSCDTLVIKQEAEITKMGAELLANGQAIVLLQKESSTLDALVKNCEKLGTLAQKEFTIQKDKLKVRIRKLIRVVIVEGAVIVVMIILLV